MYQLFLKPLFFLAAPIDWIFFYFSLSYHFSGLKLFLKVSSLPSTYLPEIRNLKHWEHLPRRPFWYPEIFECEKLKPSYWSWDNRKNRKEFIFDRIMDENYPLDSMILIKYFIMDDRPIKGNSNGQYNMNFIDPTNDIASYYDGMSELEELIVNLYLSRKGIFRRWSIVVFRSRN